MKQTLGWLLFIFIFWNMIFPDTIPLIIKLIKEKKNKKSEPDAESEKQDVLPEIISEIIPDVIVSHVGPRNLNEFIGQENQKQYIRGHLNTSLKSGKPFPHTVLFGFPGLGKSSLAKVIALEMGVKFDEVTPAMIHSASLTLGIFFNKICSGCGSSVSYSLSKCPFCKLDISIQNFEILPKTLPRQIIFFEEVHSLNKNIEEALYSVMQDGYMVIRHLGTTIEMPLPPLTIMGATTKLGLLEAPFRERFTLHIRLSHYLIDDLAKIILNVAKNDNIILSQNLALDIANISHGTPRIGKMLLQDLNSINNGEITNESLEKLKKIKQIDQLGLNGIHRKCMEYLSIRGQGGAGAIASFAGLTQQEFEEVVEPTLMFHGLIMRGNRGRVLTEKAIDLYFQNNKTKQE